jgi:hypothetical protein
MGGTEMTGLNVNDYIAGIAEAARSDLDIAIKKIHAATGLVVTGIDVNILDRDLISGQGQPTVFSVVISTTSISKPETSGTKKRPL